MLIVLRALQVFYYFPHFTGENLQCLLTKILPKLVQPVPVRARAWTCVCCSLSTLLSSYGCFWGTLAHVEVLLLPSQDSWVTRGWQGASQERGGTRRSVVTQKIMLGWSFAKKTCHSVTLGGSSPRKTKCWLLYRDSHHTFFFQAKKAKHNCILALDWDNVMAVFVSWSRSGLILLPHFCKLFWFSVVIHWRSHRFSLYVL